MLGSHAPPISGRRRLRGERIYAERIFHSTSSLMRHQVCSFVCVELLHFFVLCLSRDSRTIRALHESTNKTSMLPEVLRSQPKRKFSSEISCLHWAICAFRFPSSRAMCTRYLSRLKILVMVEITSLDIQPEPFWPDSRKEKGIATGAKGSSEGKQFQVRGSVTVSLRKVQLIQQRYAWTYTVDDYIHE